MREGGEYNLSAFSVGELISPANLELIGDCHDDDVRGDDHDDDGDGDDDSGDGDGDDDGEGDD